MTTTQKALIAAALAAAIGTGIYEAQQASALRTQIQSLQQQSPAAEQIQQLTLERDENAQKLATLRADNERLNRSTAELLRLRGENARLRTASEELSQLKAENAAKPTDGNDRIESAAKAWLTKVNRLKNLLEQMPDKKIPELQYLNDRDWLRIVERAKLDTDADVSEALSDLRDAAKQQFTRAMREALRKYIQANNDQLPTDVLQLKPYFQSPVDDASLQRYQMLKVGNVSDLQPIELVVTERAVVDDQFDTLFQFGVNGYQMHGTGKNSARTGAAWEK